MAEPLIHKRRIYLDLGNGAGWDWDSFKETEY